MAVAGNLGKAMAVANQWVSVYKAPNAIAFSSVSLINLCNNDSADVTIQISISTSSSPGTLDTIIPTFTLVVGEYQGINMLHMLSSGEAIYVLSNSSLVSVRVEGIEAATL